MSDETPESLIPYDEIVQDALRAVVGRVLGEVEQTGALARRASFLHHLQDPGAGRFDPQASCSSASRTR